MVYDICGQDFIGCERNDPYTSYVPAEGENWGCKRVQEYWNGIPLRPPVGIRAQDCSHYWRLSRYDSELMVLERRK